MQASGDAAAAAKYADRALAAAPRIPARALILYGAKDEFVPPQATRAMWAALPEGPTLAFYPDGWHLLPRDLGRDAPIGDILAWIERPYAPLPSGADAAALMAATAAVLSEAMSADSMAASCTEVRAATWSEVSTAKSVESIALMPRRSRSPPTSFTTRLMPLALPRRSSYHVFLAICPLS